MINLITASPITTTICPIIDVISISMLIIISPPY